MDYTIEREKIRGLVEKEISRIASSSYGEGGESFYDAFVIKSRDKETVDEYIEDAYKQVVLA